MGKFKGTKGKWVIGSGNPNGFKLPAIKVQVKNDDPFESWDICAVWDDLQPKEEAKANALLISKAPEMLEMLEFLNETYVEEASVRDKVEKLIKQATEL